jgi:hypothetical protein
MPRCANGSLVDANVAALRNRKPAGGDKGDVKTNHRRSRMMYRPIRQKMRRFLSPQPRAEWQSSHLGREIYVGIGEC